MRGSSITRAAAVNRINTIPCQICNSWSIVVCIGLRPHGRMLRRLMSTIPKSKLYTRTGDKGTSGLFSGSRASKDTPVFNALGTADELNAAIGVAREHCLSAAVSKELLSGQLATIQSRLLDLGALLATPHNDAYVSPETIERVKFPEDAVVQLEQWIDVHDATLPPLRNFILPVCFP